VAGHEDVALGVAREDSAGPRTAESASNWMFSMLMVTPSSVFRTETLGISATAFSSSERIASRSILIASTTLDEALPRYSTALPSDQSKERPKRSS
jgi:hypothetical protein